MSTFRFLTVISRKTSQIKAHLWQQQQQRLCWLRTLTIDPNGISCSNVGYCTNYFNNHKRSHSRVCENAINANVSQILNWSGRWSVDNKEYGRRFGTKSSPDRAGKSETKSSAAITDSDLFGEASNVGLFARFKLMYKKYWYVLIPVHVVTSIGWFGGFYYMSKSGVDVPALLQYIHISESIIGKVQHSDMGHLAIAYVCYKIATPLRYAVTLGGTTVSIKYLVQAGHIKPLPSKKEIIKMYEQKKADRAAAKAEKEIENEKK